MGKFLTIAGTDALCSSAVLPYIYGSEPDADKTADDLMIWPSPWLCAVPELLNKAGTVCIPLRY